MAVFRGAIPPASLATVFARVGYSINSILFQRGVYDPDSFQIVKKYGMKLQTTKDEGLSSYLSKVLAQLAGTRVGAEVRTHERASGKVGRSSCVVFSWFAGGPARLLPRFVFLTAISQNGSQRIR